VGVVGCVIVPNVAARLTVLPLTGLLFASRKVTVIVDVTTPSAVTLAGLAVTVDALAETAPAVNVTEAVCVIVTVSVVSVAVIVAVPAVVDAIVPVVWPFASVAAAGCVSVPNVVARLTALPFTGLLFASRNVTVIVEVATPSAVTLAGLAVTVDALAETAPAVKVTLAVCVTVIVSVTSVAVIVLGPAVLDRTVPVVCPAASVAATGCVTVPSVAVSVTVLPATGLLLVSRSVTVIVDAAVPSATTLAGLALTIEAASDTGPASHVTFDVGGCPASLVLPVVPAVASVTVMVTGPSAF
jgi:hypothetical protein